MFLIYARVAGTMKVFDLEGFFWSEVVAKYSQRAATYESDKLPALSGLVKAIALCTGSTYLAGV
jgi:hypothetical protein